ncbi:glutathione S-transferase [Mycena galopus ATCC 62051]|nr:glutathione S-transferase [Mycena galopus ATCC 62051]
MSDSSKLTLYTAPTPNGHPISIFLEELGIPYETVRMSISDSDIGKVHNQVKSPWFLEINPNGRIPAITHDGFHATFDKENKFGASAERDPRAYSEIVQWMCFAHGGIGPMQGQLSHFKRAAPEQIPYAINRYLAETRRLFAVLESRLSTRAYLVGDKYTIADIKTVTWVRRGKNFEIDVEKEFPRIQAWIDRIEARHAVKQGLKIPA